MSCTRVGHVLSTDASVSANLLAVHLDALDGRGSSVRWQPRLRVLVVEGPGWHDGGECERGASEADVECEFDVLGDEAHQESDNLAAGVSS